MQEINSIIGIGFGIWIRMKEIINYLIFLGYSLFLYFNLRELLIKVWFMALSSIPLEGNWALESAFGGSLRITQLISVSHHTWGITFGMPCHLVQYKLLAWPHVIPAVRALICHAMLYNHHLRTLTMSYLGCRDCGKPCFDTSSTMTSTSCHVFYITKLISVSQCALWSLVW